MIVHLIDRTYELMGKIYEASLKGEKLYRVRGYAQAENLGSSREAFMGPVKNLWIRN